MKKSIRLISVLLIAVLALTFAGCGKKTQTLEDIAKSNSSIQEEIDKAFASSGLDGTVEIKGNTIVMNVDITSLLGEGITLDDSTKDLLKTSFDSAFDQSEADLQSSIASIEKQYSVSGVTLQVIITYSGETVYDRSFTAA